VGFVGGGTWVLPDPKTPEALRGWFEDRIAIPWRDWDGQCIGFSGRRLDGQKWLKYKTFPGTKKSETLYGIHDPQCRAMVEAKGELVLVEGFSDVWRAWEYGLYNVVSPGGTELSPAQIAWVKSLKPRSVVILFDGDDAGVTSSRRVSDQLSSTTRVRLANIPALKDPDDLGPQEYRNSIEMAQYVFKESKR
jgi:DNA primase